MNERWSFLYDCETDPKPFKNTLVKGNFIQWTTILSSTVDEGFFSFVLIPLSFFILAFYPIFKYLNDFLDILFTF